ncbi:MAG TPA: rhomboid family intramembrane serine protease [Saprospiraceae bacterium]|nr:rhomboid family intramembrane serine protease [Saprospiraceae bacterium]HMQ81399.1 rhomboid family intramembrane serine protease [Saprospiraceae bacterium]
MSGISMTMILIVMTCLISYQGFNNPNVKYKLAFHPASVREFGEWYRFLSGGFVHSNWSHLLLNMFVLYQFGEFLEVVFTQYIFGETLGRLLYLLFYLSAIVMADIPNYYRHRENSGFSAVGASGAVSAFVFAYVLFQPWSWFIFPPLPAILFGVAYLWYSSYMGKRGGDLIDHSAHFWGALYGVVFMLCVAVFYKPELLGYFIANLLQGPSMPNF